MLKIVCFSSRHLNLMTDTLTLCQCLPYDYEAAAVLTVEDGRRIEFRDAGNYITSAVT